MGNAEYMGSLEVNPLPDRADWRVFEEAVRR